MPATSAICCGNKKRSPGFGWTEEPGEHFYDNVLACGKASQPPNLSQ